tara:strand:- start:396 stop:830 length:435 start_codon:yes stop_codon:yes gene_type:complete
MKKTLLLASTLILASCAASKQELEMAKQNELNTLIGSPEYKVIAKYGKPDKVYVIDNNTKSISFSKKEYNIGYLKEFSRNQRLVNNGFDLRKDDLIKNQAQLVHSFIDPNVREEVFYNKCTLNFIIQKGKVVDAGFKGDACLDR